MLSKEVAAQIRDAIRKGDVNTVSRLIGNDKEVLSVSTPFGSWLHVAATFGRVDIVRLLVSLGADMNARGGTLGGAAISCAASKGHAEVVKYLLDCGATMDVSEPERDPLFGAIYGGHSHIVEMLIRAGIDTRVRYTGDSMKDMDAAAFARERGQLEIAFLLTEGRTGG